MFHVNAWCISVFFSFFNIAHWLFAMIYWSLALRIECYMVEASTRKVDCIVKIVLVAGLLLNLTSGAIIVIAFYHVGSYNWRLPSELANIIPNVISVTVLFDSLRRLRRATNGFLVIEIWQMVWHLWSFAAVTLDGILLSICTRNA